MTGVLLAINLPDAMVTTKTNKRRKRNFGGIGRAAEHGFTKHGFAHRNAVQPAGELAIDPGLYAVGKAGPVQVAIGCNHGRHDPGACLALAGACRAGLNDLLEGRIDSNFTTRRFAKFLECFSE